MSDETNEVEELHDDAAAAPEDATDWKAQARKWESLAKKSKHAEDEIEEFRKSSAYEIDRANARADAAEREIAEIRASVDKMKTAKEVAELYGVPAELLQFCADEKSMEAMAEVIREQQPRVHAAATVFSPRSVLRPEDMPENWEPERSPADVFAEWAGRQMMMHNDRIRVL